MKNEFRTLLAERDALIQQNAHITAAQNIARLLMQKAREFKGCGIEETVFKFSADLALNYAEKIAGEL